MGWGEGWGGGGGREEKDCKSTEMFLRGFSKQKIKQIKQGT